MNYSNLIFTPVDFDVPDIDFGEIDFTHFQPNHSPFWNYEQLLEDPHLYDGANVWRTDLDSTRLKLKELVLQLPLTELYNVRLSIQTSEVRPHVDLALRDMPEEYLQEYKDSEPCGYRFVFRGSKESLKVIENNKAETAYLPTIPGLYLINSTSGVHYLDGDLGRIILYVRGKVDIDRHKKLIQQSLNKFNYKHAIWRF